MLAEEAQLVAPCASASAATGALPRLLSELDSELPLLFSASPQRPRGPGSGGGGTDLLSSQRAGLR